MFINFYLTNYDILEQGKPIIAIVEEESNIAQDLISEVMDMLFRRRRFISEFC